MECHRLVHQVPRCSTALQIKLQPFHATKPRILKKVPAFLRNAWVSRFLEQCKCGCFVSCCGLKTEKSCAEGAEGGRRLSSGPYPELYL